MFDDGAMVSLEAPPDATVETPAASPLVEPDAQAAAPVEPAAPADEDEPQATDGQSMVPISALREARSHLKTVKAQAQAAQADNEALRQKAAEADRMAAVIQQWAPTIKAIQERPDLVQQAQAQPKGDPALARIPDQDAAEYARDLQLYDAEGKLDISTAKRVMVRQERVAAQAAQTAVERVVAPMQKETAATKSQNLMQTAAQVKDKSGRTVNMDTLKKMFSVVPPEIAADPQVASVLYFAAKGWEAHNGTEGAAPPPPPGPVVVTEAPGGRVPAARSLTELDMRTARDMGRKPSEYQAISARFKPNDINSLEGD